MRHEQMSPFMLMSPRAPCAALMSVVQENIVCTRNGGKSQINMTQNRGAESLQIFSVSWMGLLCSELGAKCGAFWCKQIS